jgi:peptidoglycan hydrolase-like protein with peptidoglycan-binding domain
MAKATEALAAFAYYIGNGGYYEKANGASQYLTRDVSNFAANKGSGNYTYMGKLCGCNPGAWCAMTVSTAILEACGDDKEKAKAALWGRWPHYNCGTLFDDAASAGRAHYSAYQRAAKGRGGAAYTPVPGDVAIFSDNGTSRDHTGMVYACDGATVYTYEGNSGNMARKRSYSLSSAYLYGFCTPVYDAETPAYIAQFQKRLGVTVDNVYGPVTKGAAVRAHQSYLNKAYRAGLAVDGDFGALTYYATVPLRKGDENDDISVWQGLLYCKGFNPVGIDGSFGPNTEAATEAFQTSVGLSPTGVADPYTWAKMFDGKRPAHTTLRRGSNGAEVRYLQRLLTNSGYILATDGDFGPKTEAAVKRYQMDHKLAVDGVCGSQTWGSIE